MASKSSKSSKSSPSSPSSSFSSIISSASPGTASPNDTATTTSLPPGITGGGGNGGGGNQGTNGFNDPSNLQSSASLYLYTFLATLVLLLGVSAAIVIRSLLLRRRHRRMIEEAIRNGTWIPPPNGGSGRGRVDLSKKPKMWEAFLGLAGAGDASGSRDVEKAEGVEDEGKMKEKVHSLPTHSGEVVEWDAIMPFSVSSASQPTTPSSSTPPTLPASLQPRQRRTFGTLLRGIGRAPSSTSGTDSGSTTPPTTTEPAGTTGSSIPLQPIPPLPSNPSSSTTTTTSSNEKLKSTSLVLSPSLTPSSVRVAVLIAMPSPTPLQKRLDDAKRKGLEEEDLPVVEMGVVEVDVKSEEEEVVKQEERVSHESIGTSVVH